MQAERKGVLTLRHVLVTYTTVNAFRWLILDSTEIQISYSRRRRYGVVSIFHIHDIAISIPISEDIVYDTFEFDQMQNSTVRHSPHPRPSKGPIPDHSPPIPDGTEYGMNYGRDGTEPTVAFHDQDGVSGTPLSGMFPVFWNDVISG